MPSSMLYDTSDDKEAKERALDSGKEAVLSIGGLYGISYEMAVEDEARDRERAVEWIEENSLTVRVFTEDGDKPDPREDVKRPRKFQMVRILGRVRGDIYLVECFDYITGIKTHVRLVWLSNMIEWRLFDNAKLWREYADKEKKRNDVLSNALA